MITVSEVFSELVDVLFRGRGQEDAPTLFLGSGVAKAAKVATVEDLARALYPSLKQTEVPSTTPAGGDEQEEQLNTFYEYWARLSPTERSILLRRTYSEVAIPTFYQDMARLLVNGYFASVLTTSIDTLLEQALAANGMRSGSDFVVVSLAEPRELPSNLHDGLESPALPILKLHGDLAQQDVAITPEEVDRILAPRRGLVKGELSRDMVLVGYGFESEPINKWLTYTSGRLWWVSVERPTPDEIGRIQEVHEVEYVDGGSGEPTQFFGLMNIRLARLTVQPVPAEEGLESTFAPEMAARSFQPSSADLEQELLRQRLAQKKSTLRSLEQQAASQGPNPQLQAQMDYERSQLVDIENKLRTAVYAPDQIIAIVDKVARSARRYAADPNSAFYLRREVNSIKAEYKRTAPNQDVIGAAIGATLILANRLGPEVVDPKLLAQLADIAPGSARSVT
jgi:hypothetical protein